MEILVANELLFAVCKYVRKNNETKTNTLAKLDTINAVIQRIVNKFNSIFFRLYSVCVSILLLLH